MSVNLVKGQKVDLRKSSGDTLKRVVVGLGWDEAQRRGFFQRPKPIDCDASAILCENGKFQGKGDIVYFANLTHKSGAVTHLGDNLTGAGEGDDERIIVELAKLPAAYDRIVFVVNIFQAAERRQHFGLIRNAFIRVVDSDTNTELCRYNLTEDYSGRTAMITGELRREGGLWKFCAIGEGTSDGDIQALSARFM